MTDDRRLLIDCFMAAIAAVGGTRAVTRALEARAPPHPVELFAIGKAAAAMARGACDTLGDEAITGGLLITKPGHVDPADFPRLDCRYGGHPLPDAGSLAAGQALMARLTALPAGVEPLFLISGGASSLVEVPVAGVDLDTLVRVNDWLLASGQPIATMNLVRKALSRIKAGGLLAVCPPEHTPRVLAISDVPGDDPGVIGSGLLVPEPELAARCSGLHGLPDWLDRLVRHGLAARPAPTGPGPEIELVATAAHARAAALAHARAQGLATWPQSQPLTGEAAVAGQRLAARLAATTTPGLYLWSGETTVRLPPRPGRGGRNQHLALAAAIALDGRDDVTLLSAGSDGSDGPTEDAGALIDGTSCARARRLGRDPAEHLAGADAGSLFAATGELLRTGPTGTNVMDLALAIRR
ncbi:DUF4147 domain-containing protein [Marichromatium gracile]|uniref:glycerate kinase type-2 family protein n=1 Tax=Marichromatium gracile TaxID=1048 RepID=UPI001F20E0E7|nr:DUF4147 domain-containing protein [Marichromatium gracile]MCF1184495.1 DUF4147 domain-containing protein [Marichromatium gracile]